MSTWYKWFDTDHADFCDRWVKSESCRQMTDERREKISASDLEIQLQTHGSMPEEYEISRPLKNSFM